MIVNEVCSHLDFVFILFCNGYVKPLNMKIFLMLILFLNVKADIRKFQLLQNTDP